VVASLSDAVTQHRKLRYTGPLGTGAAYFDALWNVAPTLIQSPVCIQRVHSGLQEKVVRAGEMSGAPFVNLFCTILANAPGKTG
jgi:hypothetical protein